MKKLFCSLISIVGSTLAFAQQEANDKMPFPKDLTVAVKQSFGNYNIISGDEVLFRSPENKAFYSFAPNVHKVNFGDFYDGYNEIFNESNYYNRPVIKNMPPPGPNLDYSNVHLNTTGLYDKVVKK
jgi:hypothetical protein